VLLLVACSGGSGSAAKTTTTSTTTSTSAPTTTATTSPEDAVKAAYLDYWAMVDRLAAAPDPADAELELRTIDPLLESLRTDLSTRAQQGRTTRFPADPALNSHRVDHISIAAASASVDDCFVDGRIAVNPDGSVNDAVVTKRTSASLVRQGTAWKVSDVQFVDRTDGISGCAGSQ
jgi:hypothetical protein